MNIYEILSYPNKICILRWCSGQPNHGYKTTPFEKAVIIKSCGLNDAYDTNEYHFVCEKDS